MTVADAIYPIMGGMVGSLIGLALQGLIRNKKEKEQP